MIVSAWERGFLGLCSDGFDSVMLFRHGKDMAGVTAVCGDGGKAHLQWRYRARVPPDSAGDLCIEARAGSYVTKSLSLAIQFVFLGNGGKCS